MHARDRAEFSTYIAREHVARTVNKCSTAFLSDGLPLFLILVSLLPRSDDPPLAVLIFQDDILNSSPNKASAQLVGSALCKRYESITGADNSRHSLGSGLGFSFSADSPASFSSTFIFPASATTARRLLYTDHEEAPSATPTSRPTTPIRGSTGTLLQDCSLRSDMIKVSHVVV